MRLKNPVLLVHAQLLPPSRVEYIVSLVTMT